MQIIIKMREGRGGTSLQHTQWKMSFYILKYQPTLLYFRSVLQLGQRGLAGAQSLLITVHEKVQCTFELWMVSP